MKIWEKSSYATVYIILWKRTIFLPVLQTLCCQCLQASHSIACSRRLTSLLREIHGNTGVLRLYLSPLVFGTVKSWNSEERSILSLGFSICNSLVFTISSIYIQFRRCIFNSVFRYYARTVKRNTLCLDNLKKVTSLIKISILIDLIPSYLHALMFFEVYQQSDIFTNTIEVFLDAHTPLKNMYSCKRIKFIELAQCPLSLIKQTLVVPKSLQRFR